MLEGLRNVILPITMDSKIICVGIINFADELQDFQDNLGID
jgi:hypothetical protein